MPSRLCTIRDDLRRVLLSPEEAISLEVHGRTDAGVLVPLYVEDDELHAVFTKRREDLRRHPGEISFPGGRYDEGEVDLLATALREADEEIGLPRGRGRDPRRAPADADDRDRLRGVSVRRPDRSRAELDAERR